MVSAFLGKSYYLRSISMKKLLALLVLSASLFAAASMATAQTVGYFPMGMVFGSPTATTVPTPQGGTTQAYYWPMEMIFGIPAASPVPAVTAGTAVSQGVTAFPMTGFYPNF
jgi:hypothetical protein